MKGKTLNLKKIALVMAVAEGLSFDIDQILAVLFDAFMGNPVGDIGAQIIKEAYDVFQKISKEPLQTGIDIGTKVAVVYASFKALAWLLEMFGAPKSIKIAGITVRWA